MGRGTNPPPQLGQTSCKVVSTQSAQNVHSKLQMRASVEEGGRSRSQHSQLGRSSRAIVMSPFGSAERATAASLLKPAVQRLQRHEAAETVCQPDQAHVRARILPDGPRRRGTPPMPWQDRLAMTDPMSPLRRLAGRRPRRRGLSANAPEPGRSPRSSFSRLRRASSCSAGRTAHSQHRRSPTPSTA